MLFIELFASIKVKYENNLAPEIIKTIKIGNIDYFNVYELNKSFLSKISDDIIDQRLKIFMYNDELIFLLESSYLNFHSKLYNFNYPIISQDGKYYLPVYFLKKILPKLYPQKIKFNGNDIIAKTPVNNSIHTIVIDPGHGGKDPGAISYSKNNFEKTIALEIAKKLKKKLLNNLDVKIILTRDKDEFVSLQQRTQLANRENANLFISIHCNAHRKKIVNGIEVFYLSTAKTSEARAVESLENSVVYNFEGGQEAVKKYDDLAFILADMAQNEHLEESYQLALNLQSNLVNTLKCYNRGVKQANFYVLRGAFMPAVLIEIGFLSNKEEEKKLINAKYQDKIAEAIFESIKHFKYKYDQM
ncbi:MAG: N-acetylmuramoyl-L-alanine amidase [Bacteroidetes bacterium]|nr:MAG: N-acetylmuramoyl-L-alanine amidase [Bacteroidota bacterium]